MSAGGFPHLVNASDLSGTVDGPGGSVPLKFEAVSHVEDGLAWQFDVLAEFTQSGAFSLFITLDAVHLNRPFESTLEIPPIGVFPIPVTPTPVPTPTPTPSANLDAGTNLDATTSANANANANADANTSRVAK